ncbi:hypothetical protein FGO68_gene9044 [Halteria grandinella]|uniref:Proteinase inhibitor I42 chagasin domain-containing protein n=1 Tax=Halteria grandinella TaxID=5974 RepID=A0A8J8NIF0_HALGN|nr:hypothetical protein FGO68_gene9044 [Halteria grandinella]
MVKASTTTYLVFSIILLASLSHAQTTVTLDLSDHTQLIYDEVVTLSKGDTLELILKENPSTGYIWQILDELALPSQLTLRASQHVASENRRGAVGTAGVRKFLITAVEEGEGEFKIVHGRSWEIKAKLERGEDVSESVGKVIKFKVSGVPDKGL